MNEYIVGLSLAILVSVILTPLVKILALKAGIVDNPNKRRVHKIPTPRLGGFAIYISFITTYLLVEIIFDPITSNIVMGLLIGSTIVVLTGIIDDVVQLTPILKLLGQIIGAVVLISFDIKIESIHIPFYEGQFQLHYFSIPITILWVVGITNAINLIDGMDGLAAGVSGIASFSLFLVSLLMGNSIVSLVALILFGSVLGFLRYNFHPAKIFMGDTGSLFLGFCLATLSLLELKQVTVLSFLVPILILGIPISDTLYAILRRKIAGEPISQPDKKHLHHRLLEIGFNQKQTVFIIYGLSMIFALLAVILTKLALWVSVIVLILYLLVFQVIAEVLGMLSDTHKPLIKFWNWIKSFIFK
ncbi:MraY family glycosyltransferase [Guptibacillus spartinae]|uniref:MraY family glycosyltransferase n=1 Tax=Guptibacillus spartinae TaxID=3025679 RepID=UPI00235FBF00|nr:MraY family glycosyltransferase [Pseudalkalibacillus spartinae]